MKNKNILETVHFRSEIKELGFEIISLDDFFELNDPKKLTNPHIINFYAISIITKGGGLHEIDFEPFHYEENSLLFIKQNQAHAWKNYKNAQGYIILFTEDFLHNNQIKFKDLSYSYPFNSFLYKPLVKLTDRNRINTLSTLVLYLYEEYNLPTSKDKSEVLQCMLRILLLKVQAIYQSENSNLTTKHNELFIRFQRMLNEKISQSRNANDYCKWLAVSYKQLNEACKTLTKMTVKLFIDEMIILKAKQHLIDTKITISETSYILGFDEPTNFTKFFKKYTNQSPKEFKKSIFSK